MHATTLDLSRIAQDLQIRKVQVESVVQLLDEGATAPFIARYRKERTGGLNEEMIRQITRRVRQLKQLADRKQTILKSIEGQGKLTDELRQAVLAAETPRRLDDLYLPFKPKKKSIAAIPKEQGLEPCALALWNRDPAVANLEEILPTLVNPDKQLATTAEVLQGIRDILAEFIADTASVRAAIRPIFWQTGKLCTVKSETLAEDQGLEYKDYFKFAESVRVIPAHRILAINRGEREGALKVHLEWDKERSENAALDQFPWRDHPHGEVLKTAALEALSKIVYPALEREIRRELTEEAQAHPLHIFARNLRRLVLQRPLRNARILAIDPGFKGGCKLAALDEHGTLLAHEVVFPHPPQNQREEAKARLHTLLVEQRIAVIALGNGPGCRETEEVLAEAIAGQITLPPPAAVVLTPAAAAAAVPGSPAEAATPTSPLVISPEPAAQADLALVEQPVPPVSEPVTKAPSSVPSVPAVEGQEATKPAETNSVAGSDKPASATPPSFSPLDISYVIVNEAGAGAYSSSAIGREELPDYDVGLRCAISIGRRVQDPLSELVKVEPQHLVGLGLYQHDVNPRDLKEAGEMVIESCVNQVGVDLNVAGVPLLRYVSGFNSLIARDIVAHRQNHGPFRSREQLAQVVSLGPVRYGQAAGFVKVSGGDNPLDRTWIHPESYPIALKLFEAAGLTPGDIFTTDRAEDARAKLKALPIDELAKSLNQHPLTLDELRDALLFPGRDPRDELPLPIFKKGVLKIDDLSPGMELKGTVLNVVDFGVFVDVGLKDSGLVHISQMANRYIRSPYDVVAVGDVVTVWVMTVDQGRHRVSLTMIKPGTERKPQEKQRGGPEPARAGHRPPRGQRPPPRGRRAAPPGGQPAQAPTTPPAPSAPAAEGAPPAPPPRPVQRPRRPGRSRPTPKLTQAALAGATPLRTFGELKAFFEAKREEPAPTLETATNEAVASKPAEPENTPVATPS